jgi:adenosine deaminase
MQFGVVVNQLLCCINWRPEWADEVVELAKEFRGLPSCAVVGVDIAAGEEHFDSINFPALHGPHYDAMQKAASMGIPVTLHAGENADPENVRKAVFLYGATRIGHGYRASDDPKFLKNVCVDRNIHFEVCPTSSLETGGWVGGEEATDWKKHPLVKMLKAKCSLSINSDDPTVFKTSLNEEIGIVRNDMMIAEDDIRGIMRKSMEASFASEETKRSIISKLNY